MALPISSWKDRLKACFQWRHRLMHVFGVPSAIGAVSAVATASALNPDVGLSMGALTAGVGVLVVGYYVTAGFDRKLVDALAEERAAKTALQLAEARERAIALAAPALSPVLLRIAQCYDSIEVVFLDGIDDEVESVLQHSRPDLKELHDRAFRMAQLYEQLSRIVAGSDATALAEELQRTERQLRKNPAQNVADALQASKQASERALMQWQAAVDKQEQVRSIVSLIETNLQEFKLAMELRKADAAMGEHGRFPDVSELQARLAATGQACDELAGRGNPRRERRTRN